MLNEARADMVNAPHVALFPSLAIFLTVLAFNLLGDGLRDALHPKIDRQTQVLRPRSLARHTATHPVLWPVVRWTPSPILPGVTVGHTTTPAVMCKRA